MTNLLKAIPIVAALITSNAAFSCDVTLPSGTSGAVIQQNLSPLAKGTVVCLSTGSYNLGSTTLTVPTGMAL